VPRQPLRPCRREHHAVLLATSEGSGVVSEWQPIETCPANTFCLVYEDGAIRTMFRTDGVWEATAIIVDEYGQGVDPARLGVKVRETGVYEPTHWMALPEPPKESK
jgi:hypothetical protein